MSKRNQSDDETAMTRNEESQMTVVGSFMPDEMAEMMSDGFSSIETIMIGDGPGKVSMYLGELLGPGAEVEVTAPDETVNKLPTWSFHPVTKRGTVTNVTHVIPAAHQLHGALARVWEQSATLNKKAIVGIMTNGRIQTRKGRQLNTFRVFEKYVD